MNKVKTIHERFFCKVQKTDYCWNWIGSKEGNGYGAFWTRGKKERAHRAAWKMFRGDVDDETMVLHECDNRICVNPDHLYLGDKSKNMRDCCRRGRLNTSKITEKEVPEIRRLLAEKKLTQDKIGKLFGISQDEVSRIKNGDVFSYV